MIIKEENNQVVVTFSKEEFGTIKEAAVTAIEELIILSRGEVITETDKEYATKSLAILREIKVETE